MNDDQYTVVGFNDDGETLVESFSADSVFDATYRAKELYGFDDVLAVFAGAHENLFEEA